MLLGKLVATLSTTHLINIGVIRFGVSARYEINTVLGVALWDMTLLCQGGLKKNLLPDVEGGELGAVRKVILRGIVKSLVVNDVDRSDLIWFRVGEVVIFVKRDNEYPVFAQGFGEFFLTS